MPKITGPKVPASPAKIEKAKTEKAEAKTTKEAKAEGWQQKKTLPRTGWQDGAKLGQAINKAKADTEHPRLTHARTHDPVGGHESKPPIHMRYGLPNPHPVPQPPIHMRYGLPNPHPVPQPPIHMRYGLPNPHPVPQPPIHMRYGLPNPHPVNPPPIHMRYGLPMMPRSGNDTEPRPGIR